MVYLMYVVKTKVEMKVVKDVLGVCDFTEAFHKDLPRTPLDRERDIFK